MSQIPTIANSCIISPYAVQPSGYAQVEIKGKTIRHHRLVYCLSRGIPLAAIAGMTVMHRCDVRNCVNPEHLVLGTTQDNINDKVAKGRQAKGVTNAKAKLTESQVIIIRTLYAAGRHSLRDLAAIYGVGYTVISNIVNRKRWTHI